MKEVDLNALITKSAEGTDEAAQKAPIAELALSFTQLLPIVPSGSATATTRP
jgi:hypothetical protein